MISVSAPGRVASSCGDGRRFLARSLQQAGDGAVRFERHVAGEHLVADEPQRKDVRALIQLLAQRLLGRHVLHGAQQRAGLGHAVAFDGPCQAEIHDHDAAGVFHHDVLRLEIAVQDAGAVRRFQRGANLLQDLHRLIGRHLASLFENAAQIAARNQFHGHKAHARVFREVVHPHHVTVRHLVGKTDLLLETVDDGGVAGQLRPDHLQGHQPVQLPVLRLVDGAHAAGAKNGENLIAPGEDGARLKFHLALAPAAGGLGARAPALPEAGWPEAGPPYPHQCGRIAARGAEPWFRRAAHRRWSCSRLWKGRIASACRLPVAWGCPP